MPPRQPAPLVPPVGLIDIVRCVETVLLPNQRILGMAVFGEQLAVLTSTGLKLLALK